MKSATSDRNEIFTATGDAISQLIDLMLSVDENKINVVPYEGSWTAPQLLTHVRKSINGMAKAMLMEGKPADRDPGEKIEVLRDTFLDFSKKLKSPDFIVPEEGIYERQTVINKLIESFNRFKENTNSANLNELVEGLPLGPITKLEILHFVWVHTQRHLHQMKKISNALEEK
ncbi:MAG TPA: DinB family protein [Chitinophagales bacterium]|nr:DinB family protein [Chitinophagales bacterium]